jgi:large subunit ribosomal protein L23
VNTRDHHSILLRPIVSEKGYSEGQTGKYRFEVLKNASKVEIKNAVEKIFKVHVTKVNVMNQEGKARRLRMKQGFTRDWKKAIVTLREGEHIDYYERM